MADTLHHVTFERNCFSEARNLFISPSLQNIEDMERSPLLLEDNSRPFPGLQNVMPLQWIFAAIQSNMVLVPCIFCNLLKMDKLKEQYEVEKD